MPHLTNHLSVLPFETYPLGTYLSCVCVGLLILGFFINLVTTYLNFTASWATCFDFDCTREPKLLNLVIEKSKIMGEGRYTTK